jgi:DNA-binding MarR family transcriptional regulator
LVLAFPQQMGVLQMPEMQANGRSAPRSPRRRSAPVDHVDDVEDAIDRIEAAWRRERPDVDVSSVGIVSRIWRISRHLEQARKERLAEHGTDRVTLDVLAMLRRSGPPFRMTAGELTHHSLISSGGVSQRLEKLERAGLVTRHIHSDDRRRIDVELTAAGVELIDSILADLMAHEAALLDGLDPYEQEDLRRILKRLLARFESQVPDDAAKLEAMN